MRSLLSVDSMLDGSENTDLDLSAYDDLESGVDREKRLEREWLMSGGEEDLNDNGIADELERAHEAEGKPKRPGVRGLIRRMIEEAEEDWDEHGNKPLPGSQRAFSSDDEESGEAEETARETADEDRRTEDDSLEKTE